VQHGHSWTVLVAVALPSSGCSCCSGGATMDRRERRRGAWRLGLRRLQPATGRSEGRHSRLDLGLSWQDPCDAS
jgi:hypothetical protein